MRLISLTAAGLFFGAACSSHSPKIGASPSTPSDPYQGWTAVKSAKGNVELELPSGWQVLDPSQNKSGLMLEQEVASNFEINKSGPPKSQSDIIQLGHRYSLVFDRTPIQREYTMNGNVLELPASGETLADVEKDANKFLARGMAKHLRTSDVTLPAGPAKLFDYHSFVVTRTGPLDVNRLIYVLNEKGKLYMLSFAIPLLDAKLKGDPGLIAQSLKI